jgi:hypothetical protein
LVCVRRIVMRISGMMSDPSQWTISFLGQPALQGRRSSTFVGAENKAL